MLKRTLMYFLIMSFILAGVFIGLGNAQTLICNDQPLIEGQQNVPVENRTTTKFGLRFELSDGSEYIPYWSSEAEVMVDGEGRRWFPCNKVDNTTDADWRNHVTHLFQDIADLPLNQYTVWAVAYNGWGFSGPSIPLPLGPERPGSPGSLVIRFTD